MTTDTRPITSTAQNTRSRPQRSWLWPGIGVATVGLVGGLALGITSYQDSQREIDTFARMSVPGTVTVQVTEPGPRIVYYEGEESVTGNLVVAVSGPGGAAVEHAPYEAELIYETAGLTLGRAIASFDADQVGDYDVEVSGADTGQITVGENIARLALPGVLAGLAIVGLSLVAGFTLWLFSILRR